MILFFQTELRKKWDLIREAYSKPINSSKDLEVAILSYNLKYAERWNFKVLHSFFSTVSYFFLLLFNFFVPNLLMPNLFNNKLINVKYIIYLNHTDSPSSKPESFILSGQLFLSYTRSIIRTKRLKHSAN